MRAVVTGANGHLGSTLCKALVAKKYVAKALIRNPEKERLKHIDTNLFDIVDYDLLNERQLVELFHGADCIFHTAAPTQLWAKKSEEITRPIYQGTLNVIRAAAKAQVPKIIYTSTGATLGFKTPKKRELDETNFNIKTRHPQFRAKLRAEIDGSRLAANLGVRFIRVCPPNIIGPGFASCSPSTEPYVRLIKDELPAIPKVSYFTSDARDLAEAQILLAQENPRHDRYIIAAHYTTPEILLEIAQELLVDFKRPAILPPWMLVGAWLSDSMAYYTSLGTRKRALTFDLLKEYMGSEQKVSTLRFRTEFSTWQPRSLHATMSDMFNWIRNYCI